jgi:hypothetical protein
MSGAAAAVLQVGPAAFKLHLKPAQPRSTQGQPVATPHAPQCISAAGQGLGLQVLPGSIPQVDCVSAAASYGQFVAPCATPCAFCALVVPHRC